MSKKKTIQGITSEMCKYKNTMNAIPEPLTVFLMLDILFLIFLI